MRVADAARRRREAALAGHRGDAGRARSLLADPVAAVRATALGALARAGDLGAHELRVALADPDPGVRRRACELAPPVGEVDLRPLLADPDSTVVEMTAWALGERGAGAADAVDDLVRVATSHADHLVREARSEEHTS
jgi:HEAT repeat protein